jgi:hypothetical protein
MAVARRYVKAVNYNCIIKVDSIEGESINEGDVEVEGVMHDTGLAESREQWIGDKGLRTSRTVRERSEIG